MKRVAPPRFHRVLPTEAQVALIAAAVTPTPAEDPLARAKAIDRVIFRLQRTYPTLFKEPPHESET